MDKKINRRQFIGGLGAGIISLSLTGCNLQGTDEGTPTAVPTLGPTARPSSTPKPTPTDGAGVESSKLIVAEGTDPESLIENGLKALGGIEEFVKDGFKVVIKPNFSVMRKPEECATTNPELVAAVVKQCLKAGAKEVKVIDFPFMSPICLTTSGIKEAVEKAGGKAYNINSSDDYEKVEMGGKVLQSTYYSKDVLDADLLINMPILKHHYVTKITMGLKNMMGLVWDREHFHSSDLNLGIAELTAYRKPELIILDAIKGITTNGPIGPGKIQEWDQVIFGTDPVAVDAYGADLFGLKPEEVAYLVQAAKLGVGEIDLGKIKVEKV